jgi:cell division transport system permease protein
VNEPIVDPLLAAEPESTFGNDSQLIPRDSVAGRALVVVIAIMTFLACLTAGAALLVADASRVWRSDVLRDATIQVKAGSGEDIDALVAKAVSIASKAKGVESAHAYSKAESERLLEPWLGNGLDLSQLPIPRLIVVRLGSQRPEDLAALRSALASAVPEANLDDHRIWAERIGTMADAVVVVAAALFALMILAMGTAIGFATRGAMAGNREIVEVLHLVGASDKFIAREFEIHFRRLGLRGSLIGGLAAMGLFAAASLLSFWWAHSPGGDEIAAMFGSFALGPYGYVALAAVGAAVTLLTGLLSREIVLRHLQTLL